MANMNFGVNILPKANNTYTLGNSDYKWNIFANTLNGVSLTNIITDIQIDGTSIVSNNIATIPIAGALTLGLVKLDSDYGISANASGRLYLIKANSTRIKEGTSSYFPITPYNQHESVFYGLAKAAGDSTQSASENAVGVYTDTAKTAIKSMLGIQYDNELSTTSENPLQNKVINAELKKKVDLISDTIIANPAIFESTIGDMPLKSVIINQNPIQSGSSDPSPTNIRPITGINKIILNHSGKNLLDPDDLVNKNYGGNNNLYNVRPEHLIPIVPGASMVLQGLAVNETNIRFYDAEGNYQSGYTISYYGIGIETFTVPSDSYYCLPKWYRSDTELTIEEVAAVSMLYYGTESSDFVPYNSSTSYTIILPGLGKNLCSPVIKGVSIGGDNGTESTSATRATTNFIPVDFTANPNYRFSGLPNSLTMWVNAYDSNLRSLGRTSSDKRTNYTISANKFNQGTIIGTGNIAYIRLTFSAGTNDDINDVDSAQIQLEIGDTTTTYESYDNTLYGGTVDITNGTIQIEWEYQSGKWGDIKEGSASVTTGFYQGTLTFQHDVKSATSTYLDTDKLFCNICNRIQWEGASYTPEHMYIPTSNTKIVRIIGNFDDDQVVEVLAQLATPITIQFDPVEILTLKGINTIWANTNGPIEIKNYINFESFKDYIDDRTVQDVKINGTSIVSNNVATIPIATASTLGVVSNGGMGVGINSSGHLYLNYATDSLIKAGTSQYNAITAGYQHQSVFYGLAKAAGDSTQSASSNAVGTYTADAKSAIQSMLGITSMTGATSSAAGTSGLVPAPATTDVDKFLAGDGTYKSGGLPMVILSYGSSTWQDFINAYNNNVIVYCRASSNSNPATGSQTRMAFMAYVNDASSPTNVEFQYYRSMSSHSATAMGDEVYIYKLTNANGGTWSVTTRKASIKEIDVASGSKLGVSWSSDKVTLSNTMTADDMPMSSSDATTAKSAIDTLNSKMFDLTATATGSVEGNVEAAIKAVRTHMRTNNLNEGIYRVVVGTVNSALVTAQRWSSGNRITGVVTYAYDTVYSFRINENDETISKEQLALNSNLDNRTKVKEQSIDANSITDTCIIRTTSGSTNLPDSTNVEGILVSYISYLQGAYVGVQYFSAYANNKVYSRIDWYGTWKSWVQLSN